jgi:hypothetical protein
MKPIAPFSGINRRVLLSALASLPVSSSPLVPAAALAQTTTADSLLSSWNDGPAKQAILGFVRTTTERSSPSYVSPEDRIAVFDQDGTLWVEQPMYTQVVYCLERIPAVVAMRPELKNVEPFKTVLSSDREAMAKLSMRDLEKILAATLTGMSVEEFRAEANKWIETAKHPRWNRPYTELVRCPLSPHERRKSGHFLTAASCPIRRPEQVQEHARPKLRYSITSSARASTLGGIWSPSALAVFRLSTSSNLVGRMTGRSAGFSPLRILPV